MRRNLISTVCLCLIIQIAFSQNNSKKKEIFLEAEYYLLYDDYAESLPMYLKIYDPDIDNANIEYRIGLCYLHILNEKHKAIPFLEKATERISVNYREGSYRETNAPLTSLFYLGNAYRINNQLDKAINVYTKFRDQLAPKDVHNIDFVDQQIQNCKNAQELISNPIMISKTNMGEKINSRFANTNCVVSGDGNTMVFTSELKFYDAIFYTKKENEEWSTPRNITPQLRSEGKCYTTSLSFDGKTLLIFLDDNYGGNIYISHFSVEDNKWSFIEKLNKNINTRFWETHASLSSDGNTLYFSSNKTGGFGELDIYKSELDKETNDWGKAKNLGSVINTPFNDESAYITGDDDILYFSSQGHFNIGGYDIFYSKKIGDNIWSEPLNIGYPINTTDDNLFFHPMQEGIFAYYSDFDENGFGSEDILLIEIFSEDHPFKYTIKGSIAFQDNKKEFEKNKSKINIIDNENNKNIASINPNKETGQFSYKVPAGNYNIKFTGEGYNGTNKQLYIPINHMGKEITINAELEPIEVSNEEFIVIKSILFDFDDYSLNRETLIEIERLFLLMKKYPSLYIEVIGHCDSQGTYKYNLNLSKKRSRAVIDYLSNIGIEPEKFVSTGAGEKRPIANNKNVDGSDNPEGRKYNRRVELKILKSDNNIIITENNFVPINLAFSGSIDYTILLTRSAKKLNEDYFKKYEGIDPEKIKSYSSENQHIYTMSVFENKSEAVETLNLAIDQGFENAEIIDTDEIKDIIRSFKSNNNQQKYESNIFTIQILATQKPVDLSYFNNLSKVKVKKGKDNFYRYIHGKYESYDSAKKQLETIIQLGYVDAFVMNIEKYN